MVWHDAIVLLNRGGGVFEDISYIFPAHLRAIRVRWEVADFDGDGRSDMLVIPWPDQWWLVTTSGN